MLGVNSIATTLRSILAPGNNLSSELSTALISIGTTIDHMRAKQEALSKEVELVRKLSRSNWLLIINIPLPFGVTKIQAVQNLFSELGFCKPLFDADRDLMATDLVFVNRSGLLANMATFIPQRHYDHVPSAAFQKAVIEHNKKLPKEQWVAIGRVLTPREREDYDTCCSLKRLILAKLRYEKLDNPKLHVPFIIVDKRSLRLRIDKEVLTLTHFCLHVQHREMEISLFFSISFISYSLAKNPCKCEHDEILKVFCDSNYLVKVLVQSCVIVGNNVNLKVFEHSGADSIRPLRYRHEPSFSLAVPSKCAVCAEKSLKRQKIWIGGDYHLNSNLHRFDAADCLFDLGERKIKDLKRFLELNGTKACDTYLKAEEELKAMKTRPPR